MPHQCKGSTDGKPDLDWRVEITGDVLAVKAAFLQAPRTPVKQRGQINKGFTYGSRKRMLITTSKIDWSRVTTGLFVTLTYPDDVECVDSRDRNKHRYRFMRDMENHLSSRCGAIWRIEWKKRLSGLNKGKYRPHFHLIIFNVRYIPYKTINLAWKKAIGAKGHVNTDVKRLGDKRHHAVYIAKYAAKVDPLLSLDSLANLNNLGRHWGVHRRNQIPWHKTTVYDGLNDQQIERLKQIGYDTFAWYGEYAELGYTAFGVLGNRLRQAVCEICLDVGDASE